MWTCRDVLSRLSVQLWRDPGKTYRGTAENMRIDGSNYLNRLTAYLHCKGVTGHTRILVGAELDRLLSVLHAVNDLDNKAHHADNVDLEDARLAVITTYTLLGQFVRRTDMEPVEDQSICLQGDAAPSLQLEAGK